MLRRMMDNTFKCCSKAGVAATRSDAAWAQGL